MNHLVEQKTSRSGATRILRPRNVRMSHKWSCFISLKAILLCIVHGGRDCFEGVDRSNPSPFDTVLLKERRKVLNRHSRSRHPPLPAHREQQGNRLVCFGYCPSVLFPEGSGAGGLVPKVV